MNELMKTSVEVVDMDFTNFDENEHNAPGYEGVAPQRGRGRPRKNAVVGVKKTKRVKKKFT